MSDQVIKVDGEDQIVREDVAKESRGVSWAIASMVAFIVIAAAIMLFFFVGATTDGKLESPAAASNSSSR